MLDALLFAVRDGVRAVGFGYGEAECEVMVDGHPPPRAGNVFVAVHEGATSSTSHRNLDEYFGFSLTLTMRVAVPLDRVGDMLEASKLARRPGPGQPSFNARVEQLRAFLHMNWERIVLQGRTPPSANDNIAAWTAGSSPVYGFVEPARYRGGDRPALVGGEWFAAVPEAEDVGLKAEMRFERARRLQPQVAAVGVFA